MEKCERKKRGPIFSRIVREILVQGVWKSAFKKELKERLKKEGIEEVPHWACVTLYVQRFRKQGLKIVEEQKDGDVFYQLVGEHVKKRKKEKKKVQVKQSRESRIVGAGMYLVQGNNMQVRYGSCKWNVSLDAGKRVEDILCELCGGSVQVWEVEKAEGVEKGGFIVRR